MKIKLLSTVFITLLYVFAGCGKSDSVSSDTRYDFTLHKEISVTYFWIGEQGDADNGNIANIQSAWDDNWKIHYGGVDNPNNRDGYLPAGFTPHENAFYFALPYNDLNSEGKRKADALKIIPWAKEKQWSSMQSLCKNRWIKIFKGSKVAYAQWEDVGPFGENDAQYVFGKATPKNEINHHAGLDVSPAVRDYLGLSDIDKVNWQFIDSDNIPKGPWKEIVTNSQIDWE